MKMGISKTTRNPKLESTSNHLALFNQDVLRKNEKNPESIFHETFLSDLEKERITWNQRRSWRGREENFDDKMSDAVHLQKPRFAEQSEKAFFVNTSWTKEPFANLDTVSSADTETASLDEIPQTTNPCVCYLSSINPNEASLINLATISFTDTKRTLWSQIPLVDFSIATTIRIGDTEFSFYDLTQEDTFNLDGIHFEVKFEDNVEGKSSNDRRGVRVVWE